jgi:ABC-type branched-subunit amino acid transport system substrate-binding protein
MVLTQPPRPAPRARLGALAAGALCLAPSCRLFVDASARQCSSDADCAALGGEGYACGPRFTCVPPAAPAGCTSNRACIDANDGAPFLCRKADGACVSLRENGCAPLAEPGDIADDNTVWVGVMRATDPSAPNYEAGIQVVNAAELARRDLRALGPGLPPTALGRPRRPLALLACNADIGIDPLPAARYLSKEVGVPAIIGFPSSGYVVNVASNVTVAAGVLLMTSANDSPALLELPAGSPRLVWNCDPNALDFAPAVAAVPGTIFEPALRRSGALAADAPMRVAMVYNSNAFGKLVAPLLAGAVRFNGKTDVENGDNFRAVNYGDTDDPNHADAQYAAAVADVVAFDPHAVMLVGSSDVPEKLIKPIENGWPADRPRRPYYVPIPLSSFNGETAVLSFMGATADRRRRIVWPEPAGNADVISRFNLNYNATFPESKFQPGTASTAYDAV